MLDLKAMLRIFSPTVLSLLFSPGQLQKTYPGATHVPMSHNAMPAVTREQELLLPGHHLRNAMTTLPKACNVCASREGHLYQGPVIGIT